MIRTAYRSPKRALSSIVPLLCLGALAPGSAEAISSRNAISPIGSVGDQLGASVAPAGDFNGDGYADVVVGAPTNDAGGTDAGQVYIYLGNPAASTLAPLVFTGEAAGDVFGRSVASAGDMNGDGYPDIVVGAPANDAGGADAGRAYVYFGGPNPSNFPGLIMTGLAAGDNFGAAVSSAGDVNSDGYADVIVGAPGNDFGGVNAGQIYVYFGAPFPNNIYHWGLSGSAGDAFGSSVASAGDVNGDGFGDVIVGAPNNGAGGAGAGRAYVYLGNAAGTINGVPDFTFTGAAAGDAFGTCVASAGDVNRDRFPDLIVGAPDNDAGGSSAGRAYVYFGPGLLPGGALLLTGEAAYDRFADTAASARDVNGDGYGDLIVGAHSNAAGGFFAGRIYVYLGSASPDGIADLTLTGMVNSGSGYSVASAGDFDGDGFSDILVGTPTFNPGFAPSSGQATIALVYPYQILSPNGGESWIEGKTTTVSWWGHDPADLALSLDGGISFTTIATSVGGAEQNSYSLVAPGTATISARVRVSYTGQQPAHATSDVSAGFFHIVAPIAPPAAALRLQSSLVGGNQEYFGSSVASDGDFNGDGFDDVIVGEPQNSDGGSFAGKALVYYLGPTADSVPDLVLTHTGASDVFGSSVASAGDVNRDGYPDLIVGAPNSLYGSSPGRAYVYYGGPGASGVPALILTGGAVGELFGACVASVGDVNGDGASDFAVGSPNYGLGKGRVYVFFGGSTPDGTADLVLNGTPYSTQLGTSVASAGDINGDGYSDIMAGAPLAGDTGSGNGRVFVYYGGPKMDAVPDLVLAGGGTSTAGFGQSVAPAGDLNGDGFSDLIVGAPFDDTVGTDAGRAYVFLGGPGAGGEPDQTLNGSSAGEQFGASVASAGDLNRDGHPDLIVGAPNRASGGIGGSGAADIFYGGPGSRSKADLTLATYGYGLFGSVVASVGDINRDGFSDIIVGKPLGYPIGANIYDAKRYFLTSPNGGDVWPVGANRNIAWLGAQPVDVWLSSDGGASYGRILSNLGGSPSNSITLRVPHTPTKFARIRLTSSDPLIPGDDESDSLFTIQTSVALLSMLAAPAPGGASGAIVSWSTSPGPEDLAGYRLERSAGGTWQTVVPLTRETAYADPIASPVTRYRLFAVNGFGEELLLGETSFHAASPLAAWPLPYRGGNLSVSFATSGGLGGGQDPAEVSIYSASGQLVRTVARGVYGAGFQSTVWDGRDAAGRKVASGIYFLRARSSGHEKVLKLPVLR